MSNPIKKLASQTVVYGLSSIVGRFLNYLLTPLWTGIFSTEQFGIITENDEGSLYFGIKDLIANREKYEKYKKASMGNSIVFFCC